MGPGLGAARANWTALARVRKPLNESNLCGRAFPFRFRTPKRPVNGSALNRSEYPGEGGNLSEVSGMFAGVEHAGDDLDGHPPKNLFPFVQKPPSMRIDRPHLVNVLPGDSDHLGWAIGQFLCDGGMKKQASSLIAC